MPYRIGVKAFVEKVNSIYYLAMLAYCSLYDIFYHAISSSLGFSALSLGDDNLYSFTCYALQSFFSTISIRGGSHTLKHQQCPKSAIQVDI